MFCTSLYHFCLVSYSIIVALSLGTEYDYDLVLRQISCQKRCPANMLLSWSMTVGATPLSCAWCRYCYHYVYCNWYSDDHTESKEDRAQ